MRQHRCTLRSILMKTLNNFKTIDKELSAERKEYLEYCKTEALNIFNELKFDIAKDIRNKGKTFVHVVGKYDNIFKHQISQFISKMFDNEGLKLSLFNSIGWIEVVKK